MYNNNLTDYLKAQKIAKQMAQEPLLEALSSLLPQKQQALIQSLLQIDLNRFKEQMTLFSQKTSKASFYPPYQKGELSGNKEKIGLGKEACKKGECAAVLLAGGQGTRLGHLGPKGTFPISPIYHKSLFQICAEKVLRLSQKLKKDLMLVIMTSPLNDELTRKYFKQHEYFGLKESQILFFTQSMLPMLDFSGNLMIDDQAEVVLGPDGNGSCYSCLQNQGILDKLQSQSIRYLNFLPIDNPLADPFDFELFGDLILQEADVTLKTCKRLSDQEKVGILVEKDNQVLVCEYHDVDPNYSFKQQPIANLSLLALTLDFAQQMAHKPLPLHKAAKKAVYYDLEAQKNITPLHPNSWKFETYLFDVLPYSKKTTVLIYDRKKIFCPLKNKTGDFGPTFVQQSLARLGVE